jgi:predicted RNase H-like nuclease (RuvC/YqgF family)
LLVCAIAKKGAINDSQWEILVSVEQHYWHAEQDLLREARQLVAYQRAQKRLSDLEEEIQVAEEEVRQLRQNLEESQAEFEELDSEWKEARRSGDGEKIRELGKATEEAKWRKENIKADYKTSTNRRAQLVREREILRAIEKPELDALLLLRDVLI